MFRGFGRGFKTNFKFEAGRNFQAKIGNHGRNFFAGSIFRQPQRFARTMGKVFLLGGLAYGVGNLLTTPSLAHASELERFQETKDESPPLLGASKTRSGVEGKSGVPIYRIVLTGGPCGGKSTSLSHISDRLRSLGFRVFVVPESATIVITGGGIWKDYKEMTHDQKLAFEGNLMKTKLALENAFYSIAEASKEPCVIIMDRGLMDSAAYLPKESFEILLEENGWNVMNIRDRRYDAIIHLVSAAIGAEKFYTLENNLSRTETIDEARALDFRILNAWLGHPVIHIVDNSTGFDQKIKRVVARVSQIVGAPKPSNLKRKYLIANPNVEIPLPYEQFEVEQTYLVKPREQDGFSFLRRRGQNGSYHYNISLMRTVQGDESQSCVTERQISGREYVALLQQADPGRMPVKKRVKCFVFDNQYFTLSTFLEPDNGLTILEVETDNMNTKPILPHFLKSVHEVTGDSNYATYHLAKKLLDN